MGQDPWSFSSFQVKLVERDKWKVEGAFSVFPPPAFHLLLALGQSIFSLLLLIHSGRSTAW